jgi:hypothetical protein
VLCPLLHSGIHQQSKHPPLKRLHKARLPEF